MKPRIVISGVNLVDLGPLSIYRDALQSLLAACNGRYELVALVNREELIGLPSVTYMQFPHVKGSWWQRLRFEYLDSFHISRKLRPALWIAMHDITPRVQAKRQVVYCHNPSPFYRFSLREALLDPKFGLFTLFYRFLYRILIHRNFAVIVQQDWIRREFQKRYHAKNVIVANPAIQAAAIPSSPTSASPARSYTFIYPAFPRTFKNHELLLRAVRILEGRGVTGFELTLTVDPSSSRCGADLVKRYADLRSVRWLGSISRQRVYELYVESDCLVFPSKLETWGLPLTEFKTTGRPILAADLPYAHETIGTYAHVDFFSKDDAPGLADRMERAIQGTLQWQSVTAAPVPEPFAKDWAALWGIVLAGLEDAQDPEHPAT